MPPTPAVLTEIREPRLSLVLGEEEEEEEEEGREEEESLQPRTWKTENLLPPFEMRSLCYPGCF